MERKIDSYTPSNLFLIASREVKTKELRFFEDTAASSVRRSKKAREQEAFHGPIQRIDVDYGEKPRVPARCPEVGRTEQKGKVKESRESSDLKNGQTTAPLEWAVPGSFQAVGREEDDEATMVIQEEREVPLDDSHHDVLAVAHAIDEEQGAAISAPVAIEYDPDAKIPIYKQPRFKIYLAVVFLVLVGIIVGVVVGVGNDGPKTVGPATLVPTTVRDAAIVERFQALMGDEVIQEGTPAFKASEWILNEDHMALNESAENLDQRFLLAYFYFFTTKKSEWRTCGKPEEGEGADCMFDSLTFEDGTQTYIPVPATRWLSGEPECNWQGALCDSLDIVKGIEIGGNNMTGPLPPMLAKLPLLEIISLFSNEFTGTIPEEYTDIKLLRALELHYNFLTGTISPDFFKATHLQHFNVGGNKLTGSINGNESLTLANLTELKGFHVFDNGFTGAFPTELGALKFLEKTRCQNNDFEIQPLPSELGNLASLKELWIDGNSFTGTIPTEIGLATKLTDLLLNANLLEGPIPEEIFGLVNLKLLFLEKNMLNDTLSPSVGQLIKLEQIRLRENQLTGAIPSELGGLPNLRLAFLHRNLFTGSVPQELCNNVSCEGLQVLNADCGGQNPANPCNCCTACCERFSIESCFKTNFLTCN